MSLKYFPLKRKLEVQTMDKDELKKILDEKGIHWLISALVEGSIGYHTPKHAKALIDRALAGTTEDWCERCDACFKGDLMGMIDYDIMHMKHIEERDPAKAKRLLEAIEKVSGMTDEQQMTVGLAYPTLNI